MQTSPQLQVFRCRMATVPRKEQELFPVRQKKEHSFNGKKNGIWTMITDWGLTPSHLLMWCLYFYFS